MENTISASDILYREMMYFSVSQRFSDRWNVFLLESAVSKVQSPPTRTSRRNQSKAKSRPVEPEVDLQLLKTLCKENECNAEEVWAPIFVSFNHKNIFHCPLLCVHLALLVLYSQVKNVYQTSFSAFLESLDLSRSPDFPQVEWWLSQQPHCCLALLSALHLLFPSDISSCFILP